MKLKNRLLITFLLISLVPMIVVEVVLFVNQSEQTESRFIRERETAVEQEDHEIRLFLKDYTASIRSISEYPSIQGLFRTSRQEPDPIDGSSTQQNWKDRLTLVFKATAEADPLIRQIRYIDETGHERVRITSQRGNVQVIPESHLQSKRDTVYFQKTMQLTGKQVYISSIDLNREYGRIEIPHKPVIRFAAPVFDDFDGSNKGILVINVAIDPILSVITRNAAGYQIMTDQDGDILLHPQEFKRYSPSLGTDYNYFREYPDLADRVKGWTYSSYLDRSQRQFRTWRKIYYDSNDKENYWVLFSIVDESHIMAPIEKIRTLYVALGLALLIVVVVLATSVARSISEPVEKMTAAAREIAEGNFNAKIEHIRTRDEIAGLADSFNRMLLALRQSQSAAQKALAEAEVHAEKLKVQQNATLNILEDIKEARHKAEEAGKQVEYILESSPNGFLMIDRKGDIVLLNKQAERLLQCPRGEMLNQSINRFIPERYWPDYETYLRQNLPEEAVRPDGLNGDVFVKTQSGIEVPVEIGLNPIRLNEDVFVLVTLTDITQLKNNEDKIKKSNQELEQFAYVVSHDLKAPLRGIATLASWIAEDNRDRLDDEGRQNLELLTSRVKRMSALIDGILEYSRIGRVDEEQQVTDLKVLVKEVIDLLAVPPSVSVCIEGEWPMLKCAKIQMSQVFQNLISNAVKFIDKPEGRVVVRAESGDGLWKFSVEDNGPGIEEKYFDRIFQLFQTLDTAKSHDSTGVGLTLVKKIVEYHNGSIWIESEVGKGTKFIFTLPV